MAHSTLWNRYRETITPYVAKNGPEAFFPAIGVVGAPAYLPRYEHFDGTLTPLQVVSLGLPLEQTKVVINSMHADLFQRFRIINNLRVPKTPFGGMGLVAYQDALINKLKDADPDLVDFDTSRRAGPFPAWFLSEKQVIARTFHTIIESAPAYTLTPEFVENAMLYSVLEHLYGGKDPESPIDKAFAPFPKNEEGVALVRGRLMESGAREKLLAYVDRYIRELRIGIDP